MEYRAEGAFRHSGFYPHVGAFRFGSITNRRSYLMSILELYSLLPPARVANHLQVPRQYPMQRNVTSTSC